MQTGCRSTRSTRSTRSRVVRAASVSVLAALVVPVAVEAATPALRVAVVDTVGVPAMAIDLLAAEASRIIAGSAGSLSWRRIQPMQELEDTEVPVILVRGAPRLADGRRVMGSVPRDAPRPMAWIHVASVEGALSLTRPPEALNPPDLRRLGLALGRIAAHELVHALSADGEHASDGLMRRGLGERELTGSSPVIDRASARWLRRGVDRWLGRAATRVDATGVRVTRSGSLNASASEAFPR